MSDRHQIWELLDGIQMDLRAAQAKMVALRSFAAGLDLPQPSSITCPHCQLKLAGPRSLAEHLYQLHDGPTPAHYRAAEQPAESHARAQTLPIDDGEHLVAFVHANAHRLARDELEFQLTEMGAGEDELVGLLELVADLRSAET